MATSSHLVSDRVNLHELKEWLRREFLSFFEDHSGKKVVFFAVRFINCPNLIILVLFPNTKMIIWDKQLTQPLGLIADYRVLKVTLFFHCLLVESKVLKDKF